MLQHLRASEAVEDLNAKKPFKFIIILCICTKLLNYVDYLCMHFALLLFIYFISTVISLQQFLKFYVKDTE